MRDLVSKTSQGTPEADLWPLPVHTYTYNTYSLCCRKDNMDYGLVGWMLSLPLINPVGLASYSALMRLAEPTCEPKVWLALIVELWSVFKVPGLCDLVLRVIVQDRRWRQGQGNVMMIMVEGPMASINSQLSFLLVFCPWSPCEGKSSLLWYCHISTDGLYYVQTVTWLRVGVCHEKAEEPQKETRTPQKVKAQPLGVPVLSPWEVLPEP